MHIINQELILDLLHKCLRRIVINGVDAYIVHKACIARKVNPTLLKQFKLSNGEFANAIHELTHELNCRYVVSVYRCSGGKPSSRYIFVKDRDELIRILKFFINGSRNLRLHVYEV